MVNGKDLFHAFVKVKCAFIMKAGNRMLISATLNSDFPLPLYFVPSEHHSPRCVTAFQRSNGKGQRILAKLVFLRV